MMKSIAAYLFAAFVAVIPAATAQVTVNISEGTLKPTPIAIPVFEAEGADRQLATDITSVIQNDLLSTGLFEITPQSAFIQRDLSINTQPRFADWKIIQTDALVVGEVDRVTIEGVEFIRASVRLWDVYGEEVMRLEGQAGRRFTAKPEDWRRIAHKIADTIYARLTGEDPYFDSRIVYVAETGPKDDRTKRLAIMDSDGANVKYLTSGTFTVLTPRFSPRTIRALFTFGFTIRSRDREAPGDPQGAAHPARHARGRQLRPARARRGGARVRRRDLQQPPGLDGDRRQRSGHRGDGDDHPRGAQGSRGPADDGVLDRDLSRGYSADGFRYWSVTEPTNWLRMPSATRSRRDSSRAMFITSSA